MLTSHRMWVARRVCPCGRLCFFLQSLERTESEGAGPRSCSDESFVLREGLGKPNRVYYRRLHQ